MALKGTPAQVARMIETLAAAHWTTGQLKQAFGGVTRAQANAVFPASVARAGSVVRRGFYADGEGYKVDPVTRRRMAGR